MAYVDVFATPVKKERLEAYEELARTAEQVWREYGATEYVECLGDDVPQGEITSFPRAVQLQDDEVLVVSWAVYPSREVRDQAMARIMEDDRMPREPSEWPFEGKRLIWGGFVPFVGLPG